MIFVDYMSDGESHSDSNSGLLAILLKQNPNEKFYIFCNKCHFECLKRNIINLNLPIDNIKYIEIDVYPRKLEYSRFSIDYNLVKNIFKFAKEHNENRLFFTYTTTVFLYYLKWFLLFNPQIFAITTIHSELERLYILKYSSGFDGFMFYLTIIYCYFFGLYLPLSLNLNNFKCLVYGESVKNNLVRKVPLINKESIISIDMPYIIKPIVPKSSAINKIVNFGLIGLIEKKKNGIILRKLLTELDSQKEKKFYISIIGHVRNKVTLDYLKDLLCLNFIKNASEDTNFIPREIRDKLEMQVDYNIYTYSKDGYKLTASGAFMDAIFFEKPIIAIKNDYFEYYFNRYGNIGYLCNDCGELVNKLIEISQNFPTEEYNIQKNNLKYFKTKINYEYIAENNHIF